MPRFPASWVVAWAVLADVDREDTPTPLTYQLQMARQAGFSQVDVRLKHACFAAYGEVE